MIRLYAWVKQVHQADGRGDSDWEDAGRFRKEARHSTMAWI